MNSFFFMPNFHKNNGSLCCFGSKLLQMDLSKLKHRCFSMRVSCMGIFMSMHEFMLCLFMVYVVNVCLCDASVTGAELIAADGCRRVKTYIQHTDTGRRQREKGSRQNFLMSSVYYHCCNSPPLDVNQTVYSTKQKINRGMSPVGTRGMDDR